MCTPMGLMAVAGGLQAGGQVYGALGQRAAYRSQAKQYGIQRKEAQTRAMAASRDRFNEFRQVESRNKLAIAMSGFTGESFKSLMDSNRERALEDAARIEAGGRTEQGRLKAAQGDARSAAQGALVGGFLNAAGSLAQTATTLYSMRGGSLVSLGNPNTGGSYP